MMRAQVPNFDLLGLLLLKVLLRLRLLFLSERRQSHVVEGPFCLVRVKLMTELHDPIVLFLKFLLQGHQSPFQFHEQP